MVIAYHLIWTAYGWWLPNDLRGSTSHVIASDLLKEIGAIHCGRKRIQPAHRELLKFFGVAHTRLDYPVMTFTNAAINMIASGFRAVIEARRYTCYACAIMKDHVHLVIRKHKHEAEEMINHLQRESHLALRAAELFDLEHPIWGGHGWKVFLDGPDDIWRTVKYVGRQSIALQDAKAEVGLCEGL